MNISLQKIKLLLVLAILGFAFVADAQPNSYEHHHIPIGHTLVITELPGGIANTVPYGFPEHGSMWIETINNEEQIVYVPDSNFVGIDSFYIQVINPPTQNIFLGYEVEVSSSLVVTKRDFVSTTIGAPAVIHPLDNDSTSTGTLMLHEVSPIFNHGTVSINPNNDEFEFTPHSGFEGITHMSYVACNEYGACEKGVISVQVHDIGLPSSQTAEVLTSKGEPIPVLLPYPDFEISPNPQDQPTKGTLELLEDFAYLYTPYAGSTGQDTFSFVLTTPSGTSTYTVQAEILDIPPTNNFANDDYFYSPINNWGAIAALNNDSGNLLPWSLQMTSSPSHGVAWPIGNGEFKYVPNTNFEGVDQFTYKVANALGVYETATIYVTISNFNPDSDAYTFDTYEDTPVKFSYQPPFMHWMYSLNVIQGPSFGTLELEEDILNNIDNIVTYTPLVGYVGSESFDLEYCVGNDCFPFTITVNISANPTGTPGCFGVEDECVWAGDTNRDGIVDGKDVLYLCAIGEVGNPRNNASTDWIGQNAPNWNNTVQGVTKNIKHIDANGDSLITMEDINMVDFNYGKRNKITPQLLPTQQNPLSFIPRSNQIPSPGDTVLIDIFMGESANPAIDYSGVTFQMVYNADIFDTAYVEFYEHSWLGYDAPVLGFGKTPFDGKLDAAFTRGDESVKSGFGEIGTVSIVVEDITGLKLDEEFTLVQFINTSGLTRGGHLTKLNDTDVQIKINESIFNPTLRANALNVYPNPAYDEVNIQTDYYNQIEEVRVINMMGQIINIVPLTNTSETVIDVSNLESGVYIIDVMTQEGPMSSKLEVLKQ